MPRETGDGGKTRKIVCLLSRGTANPIAMPEHNGQVDLTKPGLFDKFIKNSPHRLFNKFIKNALAPDFSSFLSKSNGRFIKGVHLHRHGQKYGFQSGKVLPSPKMWTVNFCLINLSSKPAIHELD